jgi:hypothetical protein
MKASTCSCTGRGAVLGTAWRVPSEAPSGFRVEQHQRSRLDPDLDRFPCPDRALRRAAADECDLAVVAAVQEQGFEASVHVLAVDY